MRRRLVLGFGLGAVAFGAVVAAPAHASVGLATGVRHVSLRIDASGDALVTWRQGATADSVLVPPSGPLTHGGTLRGPDVSRPDAPSGIPYAVSVRRTAGGLIWALQQIELTPGAAPELDLSRWQGAATQLTLSSDGTRLRGSLSFHGAPVSGHTSTLAGRKPRVYVYLSCFGCPGAHGWSAMLGVTPKSDGSFAVLLRPSWKGSRYRATVMGPNLGSTFAPDAQTMITVG